MHERSHVDDLRGASRLVIDATRGVMSLVEAMHRTIAGGPAVLGSPLAGPARALTSAVYGSLRGATALVGSSIDFGLAQLAPLLGGSAPGREREAVLAALDGVLGDSLEESGNPLAIEMRFRHRGAPLKLEREALRAALPQASGRIAVLVHGCCMNDLQWRRNGHDHGEALARDLGFTPVYLHYNSGRHISTNGRDLSALLERLVAAWPVEVPELALVGHSMGGLISRSACHAADDAGHSWRRRLRKLVCLGSPHHGAPLERGGNWLELLLGVSRYSAPFRMLGQIRSAGVTDLRFGNVLDEHWRERDRFAHGGDPRRELRLPDGVECYAAAATTSPAAGKRLRGDGLVPVHSALGRHLRPELTLAFPEAHQWIGFGMAHLDLLDRPEVYDVLRAWLAG